ncbi:golgi uridine diphosphate-N- acetylglucosamine transporter [Penicillium rubens]|nr:golgi uridine diphosphate-N- acetylglucosamine transporter [Penicillium rubens]
MLNDHEPSKRGPDDSYLINRTRVSVNPSGNTNFASKSRSRKSDEPNYAQLKKDAPGLIAAAAHAAVPSWTSMVLMVSLIFGGCCANVFALEAIIKEQPTAGPLITFAQFVLCALFTIPSFLSPSAGPRALFLNRRAIPLRSWVVYTAYFVSVNLLNNWAFAYKISVPLHIILRSAGPVASMVIGYLYNGKRYSRGQIASVGMLTVGVAAAAIADAQSKGVSIHIDSDTADTATTVTGFTILALAMVLSAFQGIYADRLYATYVAGSVAGGGFITFFVIASGFRVIEAVRALLTQLPVQVAYLAMNALTQYLCIRGVHLLSAKSSSLTVTIFLNVRKLVSLLLSIYLFGNHLAGGVLVGAALVFVGGGLYGFEGARLRRVAKKAQ